MPFPALAPSTRSFSPGDFPQKKVRSQSGVETRILYGTKRTGMSLKLSYKNLSDADAELFLDHYHDMKGTYTTFGIRGELGGKAGWGGNLDAIGADAWENDYRYAGPPQVTQVKKGVSNVQVNLIGVL